MAEAAMSFAVQKLRDLAIQKVAFLRGVEGQVNRLKCKLEWMQCFLKEAAEKQGNDERIRKWISDIREVAQDAEDAIETFILKVETPEKSGGLLESCFCFMIHVYHLHRVGVEIESIRTRLEDIDKDRIMYGIQDLGEGVSSTRKSDNIELRRLSPWQKDKHIVGLEEDVELMLHRAILGEMNGLSVATIAGMGGLGKSTLAKEVYNHAAIADQFDCRAWVCVSNEFNPKEIIKELLLQLVEPKQQLEVLNIVEKSPVDHLKNMLHTHLKGKRYFIVLDDVWQEKSWESLRSAFPDEEDKESRLLVTSRSRDIPRCARYVHELETLGWEKSWQLFLKKAFNDDIDGKCPKDLEETGKEIVTKCYGLPLAITVVGGLLVKQRKSGWETVLKRMKSHLGSSKDSVSTILELSYNDLPPQLKSCFLCFGFFKEDATIRASKLVQLWIAEGLVPGEGGLEEETMEEIARSYLNELINRNMVQVKDTSKDDRVKTCHIHDLLRELSIRKAKEEIGFEILTEGNSQSSHKSRHRSIYCSTYSGTPNKHIRSLFFHGGGKIDGNPSFWKSFDLLRLLDLEDYALINLPDTIGALIGLRYLGLRNTKLDELPSSLGRLKNLQVLDIARNEGVKVPNIIWKMDSLRHLYMSEIRCEVPLQIDSLKNLQTLTYIPMDNWALEHAQISNLYKLGIELNKYSNASKLFTSLAILEKLVCLNLREPNYRSFPSLDGLHILERLTQLKLDGILMTLPNSFPPNLSCLILVGTFLDVDPMPVLEKLPKLLYLKFDDGAYCGEEMVISHEGFPRLKVLNLSDLSLKNLRVAKGAMPELKRLEIYKCPSMHSLPEELRCMTSLQELKMVTSVEIASKLRCENSHIISNIPNINLIDVPYEECSGISKRQFVVGMSRWIDETSAGNLDLPFTESSVISEKLKRLVENNRCIDKSEIRETELVEEMSRLIDDRWIAESEISEREFVEGMSRWLGQKSGDL